MAAPCGLECRRAAVGIRGIEVAPGADEELETHLVGVLPCSPNPGSGRDWGTWLGNCCCGSAGVSGLGAGEATITDLAPVAEVEAHLLTRAGEIGPRLAPPPSPSKHYYDGHGWHDLEASDCELLVPPTDANALRPVTVIRMPLHRLDSSSYGIRVLVP